jgi:hypothetical protein
MISLNKRYPVVMTLQGNNTPDIVCDLPVALKTNLTQKALGVGTMTMNNSNIPVFIPELMSEETNNYDCGTTGTSTYIGKTGGINALDYFLVFRRADNSEAVMAVVQWIPQPSQKVPFSVPDENSVFTTPYYYCFDFMNFLGMITSQLNNAILVYEPSTISSLNLDSETNTYNLYIQDNISMLMDYQLEFSPKLKELLPFETVEVNLGSSKTYRVNWNTFTMSINNVKYWNASAPMYDVFPFDLILMNCNLPMIPIEFVSNVASAYPLQKEVFFMFEKAEPGINIYNKFRLVNDYLYDKLHRFTQDKPATNKFKTILILRTKKNKNYLEWNYPSTSEITLSLSVFEL